VPTVDDEASCDRPGTGQLLGKGRRAEPVAEKEHCPRGTHAPFQHAPAADRVPAQLLLKKLVLVRSEASRALIGPTET
jgi:hypothetical protein